MSAEPRAWHRLHLSTWLVLALALVAWVLVMVPGEISRFESVICEPIDTTPVEIEHGWPLCYLTRTASEKSQDLGPLRFANGPPWINEAGWAFALGERTWGVGNLWIDLAVGAALVALPTAIWERRKRRRRFWQFSLRELLVAMACVAGVAAWFVVKRGQFDRELASLNKLTRVNNPEFAFGRGPQWLGKLIGKESRDVLLGRFAWTHVEKLVSDPVEFKDEQLRLLETLRHLRRLYYYNEYVRADEVATIGSLTRLELLHIHNARIDEDALAHLGRLVELKELTSYNCKLTDRGVMHLSGLVKLQTLSVGESAISKRGVEALMSHQELKIVELGTSNLDDAGLLRLAALAKLVQLFIETEGLSTATIARFKRMRPDVELNIRPPEPEKAGGKRGGR